MPGLHQGHRAYGEFTRGSQRVAWDVFAFYDADLGYAVAKPLFSRSGFTNPFGKLGKPINGVSLPIDLDEQFREVADQEGLPIAEVLRSWIVIQAAGGPDAYKATTDARTDAIARIRLKE